MSTPHQTPSNTTQTMPDASLPTTQQASSARPTRRRRRRPAQGSLNDIMRQNAGASLFVRPICWTDRHSQLLGVQFRELPSCDTPLPPNIPGSPPSRGHMRPSHTITKLSDALTEILLPAVVHPYLSSNAIKTVLATLWPNAFGEPHILPELHLFFGGRVYRDAVRAQVMWNFASDTSKSSYSSFRSESTVPADSFNPPSTSSSPGCPTPADLPMVCYIGKNQLASIRKNIFRVIPGPNRSWNEPVYQLQQLRAKLLKPSNPDEDAHFVGIFLAMAQKHFYGTPPPSSRRDSEWSPGNRRPACPNFRDIKLRLLTHDTDTAEFIVYTGYLSAKFLERFHDPRKVPTGDEDQEVAGLKIEYTRVPIWPILGLRERLGKAMGEDVVGPFDSTEIESWEEDVEVPTSGKRKRAALAEVFNGSFEEQSDDESVLSGKRQRLDQGNPVGVVV